MRLSIMRTILMHASVVLLAGLVLSGCAAPTAEPEATVTSGSGASIQQAQAEAYDGPKARLAVSRFEDQTGKGWYSGKIGDGMADQLATALFNTNRYIVLERPQLGDVLQEQDLGASGRVREDTAAPVGPIEGAELLITGAVTEFEDSAAGGGGGLGGFGGGVVGAGTGHPVLGTVRRGDRLPILGESGSWYQIRLRDGREGWIFNKLVR